MPNRPPDHCPHCGTELAAVDPPTEHYCEACDRLVFYNPTPTARVAHGPPATGQGLVRLVAGTGARGAGG